MSTYPLYFTGFT